MSPPSSAEASSAGRPTAVERAAAEPNLSSETNQLEAALLASPKLPNFAGVGQLVGELEECPDTDVTAVHSVIAGDGPLAKEVVRIVNAPLYKLPREVRSVREAVLIMGIEPLRNLALALSYVSRFRSQVLYRRGIDFLWQTSLMTGVAARRLASITEHMPAEEAFLAGLMADCAVIVMYRTVPGYRDVVERFRLGEGDLIDLEREAFPTDHARLGSRFLRQWGFHDRLADLVGAQHDPDLMTSQLDELRTAKILKASWLCARALTVTGYHWEAKWIGPRVAELLNLPPKAVDRLERELLREFKEAAIIFDIPAVLPSSPPDSGAARR